MDPLERVPIEERPLVQTALTIHVLSPENLPDVLGALEAARAQGIVFTSSRSRWRRDSSPDRRSRRSRR